MKWPATFEELEEAGYGYTGTSKECSCGSKMLWWITPARKWMPLSFIPSGSGSGETSKLTPHHAVCVNARHFKSAKRRFLSRGERQPKQEKLFK